MVNKNPHHTKPSTHVLLSHRCIKKSKFSLWSLDLNSNLSTDLENTETKNPRWSSMKPSDLNSKPTFRLHVPIGTFLHFPCSFCLILLMNFEGVTISFIFQPKAFVVLFWKVSGMWNLKTFQCQIFYFIALFY